jgi:hypothetical protein
MWQPQNARERLMDPDAVGPEQFTISQQTYVASMPHQGRTPPFAGEGHVAKITRSADGGTTMYSDLGYDPMTDDWAEDPWTIGPDYAAVKP